MAADTFFWDWTGWLAGETIASFSLRATSPLALLGNTTNTNGVIGVQISYIQDGNTYPAVCQVTSSTGRADQQTIYIRDGHLVTLPVVSEGSVYGFDPAAFQGQFPEFATVAPTALTAYWTMATAYLNPADGYTLNGAPLQLALALMTAHLARSMAMLAAGQTGVVVAGASEGSVSVSAVPPPAKSSWQWWLSTTPYGLQLMALMSLQSAGGYYIGGLPERAAFRKVAGVW